MADTSSPKYDMLRNWIRTALENGVSWEALKFLRQSDKEGLRTELNRRMLNDFWPDETTVEVWQEIVSSMEEDEQRRKELSIRTDKAMLTDKSEENGAFAPIEKYSSWILYKNYLIDSGWKEESIAEIESATVQILRRLKGDTASDKPVKGLVVGHVQSGKTANMAALMAMAADWGWNMFVVLSGTIENLRVQTQSRLFNDLNRDGNILWRGLQHLSLQSSLGERAQDLSFESANRNRYFTVCLKNSKRLENLIRWMQADKKKLRQMKVIVIDDEADQGGVNTARISKNERSKINQLIVNLVEGNTYLSEKFNGGPMAMNYIGYTATPYANFLNESHPESLYPSSFIRTLQPSSEYFGPRQIFGIEGTEDCDGIDILRDVDAESLELIRQIHEGGPFDLPNALRESLAWFLCASSAMRFIGYKKPISMLVHTSQRQGHHQNVARAIDLWISWEAETGQLKPICKAIWEREIVRFSMEAFHEQLPDYPEDGAIKDYPAFEEIWPGIATLAAKLSHIYMSEDNQLTYHSGIHLCIDNCANNGVNDENMFVRLAYPDSANCPQPAPVFIVVGGSTLSRGLTIEGLVSTFFLRAANQADSLMQMGRWFGYRKGYELYPRIWMSSATREKFVFLAQLEQELRDDLIQYMNDRISPADYGPRIKNSPKLTWLRITAASRMQNATAAQMDFSGTNVQTVVFSEEKSDLKHNITVADEFFGTLGNGDKSRTSDSIVWRGVQFNVIKEKLFDKYHFHSRASFFNQINAFCEWYNQTASEAGYTDWNVIAAGNKYKEGEAFWKVPGGTVGKINRSRKVQDSHEKSVSIGVLRAPKDLYEDIEAGQIEEEELKQYSKSALNDQIREARTKAGLANTPLLILYRIDKASEAQDPVKTPIDGQRRAKLNVDEDIIGISIWIPGVKSKSFVKTLTVKINKQDIDIDDEAGGTSEN